MPSAASSCGSTAAATLLVISSWTANISPASLIVALGPLVDARGRVDELSTDPHALARAAHAALQNVAHAELKGDLLHVDGRSL